MPVYSCPKGHSSTEGDFCSECGAKINGANNGSHVPPPTSPIKGACPDCKSPRPSDATVFCEVCGYNYQTGGHGEIPIDPLPPPPEPEPAPTPVPAPSAPTWTVVASADPSLKEQGSPDPPSGLRPLFFTIDKDTCLIGRKSEPRGIFPEISLDFDSAVSHRHALLTRTGNATLLLRDVGSSNGTRVNGADIPPMTDFPVREGDRITLGHWTCLKIERAK
jgi:hypothetical protein